MSANCRHVEQYGPLSCKTEGRGPADQINGAEQLVRVDAGAASFIGEFDHYGAFEAQTEARGIAELGGENDVVQRTLAHSALGGRFVAVVPI